MTLLCEATLNKIRWLSGYGVGYILTSSKGKTTGKKSGACFMAITSDIQERFNKVGDDPYVLVDIFFEDRVHQTLKTFTKTSDKLVPKYLRVLKSLGMFRKVVEHEVTELVSVTTHRFRFDLSKTSMRELFFVGSYFRMFSEWPVYVYNFLKINEAAPNVDAWTKLTAASTIKMWEKCTRLPNGHSMVNQGDKYFIRTPEEYYELIEKQEWPMGTEHASFVYNKKGVHCSNSEYIYKTGGRTNYDHKFCLEYLESFSSKERYYLWINIQSKFPSYQKPKETW